LFGSFVPICRRRRQQVRFQFGLPKAQRLLVRFDVRQQATKLGRLLGSHAAMLIQVDRFFGHYFGRFVQMGVELRICNPRNGCVGQCFAPVRTRK
jgi:hypothetical protein